MDGERRLPKEWGLPIMISECSKDAAHRLYWRGRIWVPAFEPLQTRLIQSIHDSPLSGHPDRESTRELLAREYTWLGMTQDVRRFVRNCNTYGKSKIWREQKHGLLKPLLILSTFGVNCPLISLQDWHQARIVQISWLLQIDYQSQLLLCQ